MQQAKAQASEADGHDTYRAAFQACLRARGY
jgi:hypothetical protein